MGRRKALLPLALVLSAISAVLGVLPFVFIWLIIKELLISGTTSSIVSIYAWWAAGTAIAGLVIYFLALMSSHLAAFRAEVNMRRVAMKKIVKLPLGFFDNNTSGKIRKIIDENASITHNFLAHQLPDLAGTVLMPTVALVLIFIFDWRLGLACLAPLFLSMGIMGFMMGKRGRYFMKKYMSSLEDMNTEAVEYVRGIPVVKVFQQTIFSFKNFYKSIMDYKDMVYKYTLLWQKPMSTYTVIIHGFAYFLIPVAVLLIGNSASYVSIIVDLIFFILITPVFAQCIMRSMSLNQMMMQATEAVNRIEELTKFNPLKESLKPKSISSNKINFQEVSFSYPGSKQNAVDNVSFTIPEGKTFALVGPSGSGKTTIARLVPRFWDACKGNVKVGGVDVKDILQKELMQNISFVFQNSRLFKASLRENVCYGKPGATEKEITDALKLAKCEDIISKLPDGLDTKIGAKGTYLSGGEQQRILLARAFLKNSPIVILDEATSFADPENEHLIKKAFEKLTEGKTVLMIAHRLTSVVDADCILVLEKGKISEYGQHEELLKKKGLYAKMWKEYKKSAKWTIRGGEKK